MIQDLLTNKKYLFASGANTELRAQRNLNRRAVLLNGSLVGNVRTEQFGVSARVYENGVYGFSSTAEYTDETVKAVLQAASENAAFLAKHAGKGKGPHKAMAPSRSLTAYDLTAVEQRTYIEFGQALDSYIVQKYPDLVSRTVVVMAVRQQRLRRPQHHPPELHLRDDDRHGRRRQARGAPQGGGRRLRLLR